MATSQSRVPSRQDRQAARLRGAGTAKVANVGFRIQGGPALRTRTPGKTPVRTPAPRRPQLEDLLPPPSTARSKTKTPMGPPSQPPTAKKQSVGRGRPVSRRQTIASPSIESVKPSITPIQRKPQRRQRKSEQVPAVTPPEPTPEPHRTPIPEPSTSQARSQKRKPATQGPRPSKRPRKSVTIPPPSPSPSIPSSASVVSSPSPSLSPEPPKRRKRIDDSDTEPGTIEILVHKLPPNQGGTRTLNEIDGFLQIATEVLTRGVQQIQSRDATQAKILDAFTEEVTIRLIEMTDVWDKYVVLVGAVRRAQKRKGALRQELLAVRREREGIRREMEGIRQAHESGEEEMREFKKQQDFISDMEELKARVPDTDDDQIKNGVEAALVELRPLVAGKSGIAERLASFNRFLERFDNALTRLAT